MPPLLLHLWYVWRLKLCGEWQKHLGRWKHKWKQYFCSRSQFLTSPNLSGFQPNIQRNYYSKFQYLQKTPIYCYIISISCRLGAAHCSFFALWINVMQKLHRDLVECLSTCLTSPVAAVRNPLCFMSTLWLQEVLHLVHSSSCVDAPVQVSFEFLGQSSSSKPLTSVQIDYAKATYFK